MALRRIVIIKFHFRKTHSSHRVSLPGGGKTGGGGMKRGLLQSSSS